MSNLALRRRPRLAARVAVVAAVVLVAPLVAGACSSDDDSAVTSTTAATAPAQNPGQAVERFNDPDAPIAVPVSQVFEITLQADAEACFSWDLATTDSAVVTLQTSRPSAIATQDDPPLTGASDLDVFEFVAAAPGTVDLTFNEISPCEPGATRDSATFTVVVSDN